MPANTNVRFTDFTNDFKPHPITGDLGLMFDVNCIKNSLKNLILTNKYERLDPNIGTNVDKLLFENSIGTTVAVLQSYIKNTVENYEKRVQLIDVICTPDDAHNTFLITIKFKVQFLESVQTVNFFLQRVR